MTLIANQITEPTCAAAVPEPGPGSTETFTGTITVVKNVINDNGGTQTPSNFQLFVNGSPVISGTTYAFPAPAGPYTVTESADARYTRTFSGDCDANGQMSLAPSDFKVCIITNNDIGPATVVPVVPPIIEVVKVPSPLSLPAGPGPVTYTYTLRNIGTVPVTNVTMIGDTCAPITRISGDTNGNNILEVSETWVHTCNTTLSATHTNTVVATGMANGITATDIASATVVVGAPIVPPLIHVTKVPSPLTLGVGGGPVTFTKRVTNLGTVALSNVRLVDDECNPVAFVSGDTDGDSQLDVTETWTYTCTTNITQTTINTVIASGDANGLTARDIATVPVVVAAAVPALPVTGASSADSLRLWGSLAAGLVAAAYLVSASRKKQAKQTK